MKMKNMNPFPNNQGRSSSGGPSLGGQSGTVGHNDNMRGAMGGINNSHRNNRMQQNPNQRQNTQQNPPQQNFSQKRPY